MYMVRDAAQQWCCTAAVWQVVEAAKKFAGSVPANVSVQLLGLLAQIGLVDRPVTQVHQGGSAKVWQPFC